MQSRWGFRSPVCSALAGNPTSKRLPPTTLIKSELMCYQRSFSYLYSSSRCNDCIHLEQNTKTHLYGQLKFCKLVPYIPNSFSVADIKSVYIKDNFILNFSFLLFVLIWCTYLEWFSELVHFRIFFWHRSQYFIFCVVVQNFYKSLSIEIFSMG